jgi:membrane-associated protein
LNLEHILSPMLHLTASFDLRTAGFLFLLCAIGEFGFSLPYVLESVWLLAGYQMGAGVLSPLHLLGLWFAAQCGRQVGAMALYSVARLGSTPLSKLYDRLKNSRFWPRMKVSEKLTGRIHLTSPFSIAYGRLLGLRIPLTMMLAFKKKFATALTAVLFSSLVWDGIYIILGATVGRTAILKPVQMLLASVAALTLLYLVTIAVRLLFKKPQPAGD